MAILNKLEKQTDNKFLNMYKANFTNEQTGKDFDYFIATRRDEKHMACKNSENHNICDAVMIIPKTEDDCLVLIKQFRPAINDYIYEFPAGLVDPKEAIEKTVVRELKEETGLDTATIVPFIAEPSYNSEGMCDETLCVYSVLAKGDISTKYKEENEDIEIIKININDLEKFYEKNKMHISLKTKLILNFVMQSKIIAKNAIEEFVDTIIKHSELEK